MPGTRIKVDRLAVWFPHTWREGTKGRGINDWNPFFFPFTQPSARSKERVLYGLVTTSLNVNRFLFVQSGHFYAHLDSEYWYLDLGSRNLSPHWLEMVPIAKFSPCEGPSYCDFRIWKHLNFSRHRHFQIKGNKGVLLMHKVFLWQ